MSNRRLIPPEADEVLQLLLKFDSRLMVLLKQVQDETADIDLFAPLPPTEDCPICCIPLPRTLRDTAFFSCCGVVICCGCDEKKTFTNLIDNMRKFGVNSKQAEENTVLCAFCREPNRKGDSEEIRALEKLVKEKRTAEAFNQLAMHYFRENVERDREKQLELLIQGAELGHAHCLGVIGLQYKTTCRIVLQPYFRAFLEVAAKKGSITHREYLAKWGELPLETSIKHWKVGASAGSQKSLDEVMKAYKNGNIQKYELAQVLRDFQASNDAVKSPDRDEYIKRYNGQGRPDE